MRSIGAKKCCSCKILLNSQPSFLQPESFLSPHNSSQTCTQMRFSRSNGAKFGRNIVANPFAGHHTIALHCLPFSRVTQVEKSSIFSELYSLLQQWDILCITFCIIFHCDFDDDDNDEVRHTEVISPRAYPNCHVVKRVELLVQLQPLTVK